MTMPSIFVIVRGIDFLKVNDDVLVCASREQAELILAKLAGPPDPLMRVIEYVPRQLQ